MSKNPSLQRVRDLLSYDEEAGRLSWRKSRGNRSSGSDAGSKAGNGYRQVRIDGAVLMEHRVIWLLMTGKWPIEIDHIDHDRQNNRWSNLREVERRENHENRIRARRGTKTGVLGVRLRKNGRPFSEIKINGKYVYLGTFDSIGRAREAYLCAKREHHISQKEDLIR